MASRKILVIAGPTGVGKSSLAVGIAQAVGAEIVSADSRQLYRGLDIGTAALSLREQGGIPHHLLGAQPLGERVSSGWWMSQAFIAITDIHKRGRAVIVVGGSTLYIHALVEGLAELAAVDAEVEAEIGTEQAAPGGAERLWEELRSADPVAAATLDPSKSQRLARLVGVLRTTGRPPSAAWASQKAPPFETRLIVLDRPRPELYAAIEQRVEAMMERGLLHEARTALDSSPGARQTLESTIGYRELLPVLDGTADLDDAVRLIKRNSRRYAKRQLTWYRRYPDAIWLDARNATPERVLDRVAPWPRTSS